MALKLEQKQAIVAEVASYTNGALSMVAADYRGLTAAEMTKLRADARNVGVKIKIVRNTLARRALTGTPYECMTETLVGPLLLAIAYNDPGSNARLLRDFAKTNDKLEIKSLSLGGKLFGKEHINAIASLPTKDEAIAKLMSVMQAPIAKFVRTVAEPQAKLVRTFAALRDQMRENAA